MALTKDFRQTVKSRADNDPVFRAELLRLAINSMFGDDFDVGKAMLKDYINSTIGFETLALALAINAKSLHRSLGPKGNPQAKTLFPVLNYLQKLENMHIHATV